MRITVRYHEILDSQEMTTAEKAGYILAISRIDSDVRELTLQEARMLVSSYCFEVPNAPIHNYQDCTTALRLALPYLIRLGDFIGDGERDAPMGRHNAMLAVKNALAGSEGGEL